MYTTIMNIRELDKIKDKGAKVSNDQWVKKTLKF